MRFRDEFFAHLARPGDPVELAATEFFAKPALAPVLALKQLPVKRDRPTVPSKKYAAISISYGAPAHVTRFEADSAPFGSRPGPGMQPGNT